MSQEYVSMSCYQFADCLFDTERGLLIRNDQQLHVRPKVAQLMAYLIEHRDRVISKEELLTELWQHGEFRENSLTQSVREARRLLGDSAQQPNFIRNYPQRGYQWIAQVERQSVQPDSAADPLVPEADGVELLPGEGRTPGRPARQRWLMATLLMVLLTLGVGGWWLRQEPPALPVLESADITERTPRLMVMPFINDTGDPALQWMELGLSDMLAGALAAGGGLNVIPPAQSHTLLAVDGLDWPPSPDTLQPLMKQHGIELLLLSRVTLYRDQQVLNVRLYRADGRVSQGSIGYPQLAVATHAVVAQLRQLIDPQQPPVEAPALATHPASLQDFVRGLQALQQQGAPLAQNYFDAALLQDAGNQWARSYGAMTRLQQGQWQQAVTRFEQIDAAGDPNLQNFICRWRAEVDYRRGELATAEQRLRQCIERARHSGDQRIEHQSYRLLAQIAHQQLDWPQFRQWSRRASALLGDSGDLSIQAEQLFYLGNPVDSGLEKDPANDLLQNGPRLKQALAYFQALANQPMIAATQFALAQNYTLPLAEREAALAEAIMLWRQLQAPFELAQALAYQGFYRLQLHQGAEAVAPLEEAIELADGLGARYLAHLSRFYRAFADLDMGLDRGQGRDPEALQRALSGFDRLLQQPDLAAKERADSQFMRGWALAGLDRLEEANRSLQRARDWYRQQGFDTSFGYAIYSMMWNHLQQGELNRVVELGEAPVHTRLQLRYLAEAYHRLQDYPRALAMLERIVEQFPVSWSDDRQWLERYRTLPQLGLGSPPSPYLVYCESDWQLERSAVNLRPAD
ncbi:winged helix-turn-helix domain-containing protein [Marinobacterium arenosum]|uniref:winged helix-turn-helix domain-containing protein n=1 Tax=Marinobacterium arenosum TaxID=2862496 RepID=UPI001C94039B|nr:winged helix-turn-helix domain-containing protein [Marinobacterium arenosum]MBY4677753.1 winged helix-turn-helix domain-containing protein [Marinobacterium arenosum]